ncbi:MAG: PAS domain S-box protein, partial [Gemmatimonadota bacterium]
MMDVSAQFDDIQRLACLGCWEWHVATDRVTWTDGLFRIYGLNPSHFDPTFDGYIARVHADDRERVQ